MSHHLESFDVDTMIDDGFGRWFSGYVDGEGSFMLQKHKGTFIPRFGIATRWDDVDLLKECRRRLMGIGRIYAKPRGRRSADGYQRKPWHQWEVWTAYEMCLCLIPVLEKYPLRSRKRMDFEWFSRASHLLYSKQQSGPGKYTPELRSQLMYIYEALRELKKPPATPRDSQ